MQIKCDEASSSRELTPEKFAKQDICPICKKIVKINRHHPGLCKHIVEINKKALAIASKAIKESQQNVCTNINVQEKKVEKSINDTISKAN
jgi:hypothetical protein